MSFPTLPSLLISPPSSFSFNFSTISALSNALSPAKFLFYKNGLNYYTDTSSRQFIDPACYATTNSYDVDPVNGNDGNTGIGHYDGEFLASKALKTIDAAITKGNLTGAAYRINLKGGTTYCLTDILTPGAAVNASTTALVAGTAYVVQAVGTTTTWANVGSTGVLGETFVCSTATTVGGSGASVAPFSANAVFPTQSVVVKGFGINRATLSTHVNPNVWTDDGTSTNTYQAKVPLGSSTYPVERVLDLLSQNGFGSYVDIVPSAYSGASKALVNSFVFPANTTTGGIYFYDSAANIVYIRRADGAAITNANTRIILSMDAVGIGNQVTAYAGKKYHFEHCEAHGGRNGAFSFTPSNTAGRIATVWSGYDCAARYSSKNSSSGFQINGVGLSILEKGEASGNLTDGYNVHDNLGNVSIGTHAVDINPIGYYDNGRGFSTALIGSSCNGFTVHDGIRAIALNPKYELNGGGNLAFVSIGSTTGASIRMQGWVMGGYIGQSRGNPATSQSIGGISGTGTLQHGIWNSAGDLWLDGVSVQSYGGSGTGYALWTDNWEADTQAGLTYVRNCIINGPASAGQDVASIVGDGTTATITTTAPHNLTGSLTANIIAVTGLTGFNANGVIVTVTGPTTLTYSNSTVGSGTIPSQTTVLITPNNAYTTY